MDNIVSFKPFAKTANAKGPLAPNPGDLRTFEDAYREFATPFQRGFIDQRGGLQLQLNRIQNDLLTPLPNGVYEYPNVLESSRRYPLKALQTLAVEAAFDNLKRDFSKRRMFHHSERIAEDNAITFGIDDIANIIIGEWHDGFEDPKVPIGDIQKMAGNNVANGVLWLTNDFGVKTKDWKYDQFAKACFQDRMARDYYVEHPYIGITKLNDKHDGPRSDLRDFKDRLIEVRGQNVMIVADEKVAAPLEKFQLKLGLADKFITDYLTIARSVGHWRLGGVDPTYARMAERRESLWVTMRDELKPVLEIDRRRWKEVQNEILANNIVPLKVDASSRSQTFFGEPVKHDVREGPTRREVFNLGRVAALLGVTAGVGEIGESALTGGRVVTGWTSVVDTVSAYGTRFASMFRAAPTLDG